MQDLSAYRPPSAAQSSKAAGTRRFSLNSASAAFTPATAPQSAAAPSAAALNPAVAAFTPALAPLNAAVAAFTPAMAPLNPPVAKLTPAAADTGASESGGQLNPKAAEFVPGLQLLAPSVYRTQLEERLRLREANPSAPQTGRVGLADLFFNGMTGLLGDRPAPPPTRPAPKARKAPPPWVAVDEESFKFELDAPEIGHESPSKEWERRQREELERHHREGGGSVDSELSEDFAGLHGHSTGSQGP